MAFVCAHRVHRDAHSLDDSVGKRLHEHAVHEGARVAFVTVADHALGLAGRLPDDTPLHARRKTGAARPRNPLWRTSLTTSAGCIFSRQRPSAVKPPCARYSSRSNGSLLPKCSVAIWTCGPKKAATSWSRGVTARVCNGIREASSSRRSRVRVTRLRTRVATRRAKMSRDEGLDRRLGDIRVDFGGPAGNFDFDRRRCSHISPQATRLICTGTSVSRRVSTERNVRSQPLARQQESRQILTWPFLGPGTGAGQAGPEERLAMALTRLDPANQVGNPVGRLRAIDVLSATHHRREGAAADAEDLLDGILSGRVGIVIAGNVEIIAQHVVDAIGPFDVTSGAVADANQVPPHGTMPELRVERRDAGDLCQSNVALLRHPAQRLAGQIAVMALQGLQHGQNPVRLAPQTGERLIDKGEIEFHHPTPDASQLA